MTRPAVFLMVPAWRYTAGTLLPLARRLAREGEAVHFLLQDWDERTGPEIEASGFSFETVDLPQPAGSYPTRLLLGHRTPRILRERVWQRIAAERIRKLGPRIVVVNNETWFEASLIRAAHRAGIPSLAVQWAFALPQKYFDAQRNDVVRRRGGTPASFLISKAQEGFRAPVRRALLHRLVRDAIRPVQTLNALAASRLVGLKRRNASWGTGEATLKTVIGPAFRDQFVSQGADPARLRVTGLSEHDDLFALATDGERRARLRRETRERFALSEQDILAVVGARATREDGYPAEEAYGELRAVVRTLLKQSESLRVVVKLHPRQTIEEVARELVASDRLTLVRDIDKGPLFAAADLFLSTFSSVILWAIALDLPVVTFNCLRIPGGDIFEEIGGTVHARRETDLPLAVSKALRDEPTRRRLALERDAVRHSHMVFDGHCVERITNLCRELAGREAMRLR